MNISMDRIMRTPDANTNLPYHEIVPQLFLGNVASPRARQYNLVVNCTRDLPAPDYLTTVVRLAVNDDPAESDLLFNLITHTQVLERMHECLMRQESVLVHCYAGMQRSCAVVACYLIRYYQMTPEKAVLYLRSKRRVAFFGGANFARTLQEYHRWVEAGAVV